MFVLFHRRTILGRFRKYLSRRLYFVPGLLFFLPQCHSCMVSRYFSSCSKQLTNLVTLKANLAMQANMVLNVNMTIMSIGPRPLHTGQSGPDLNSTLSEITPIWGQWLLFWSSLWLAVVLIRTAGSSHPGQEKTLKLPVFYIYRVWRQQWTHGGLSS